MKQGTPEWYAARCGHATASRFSDILAKPKSGSGESVSRRNYRIEVVTERLTGVPLEGYTNAAMAWGLEQEPFARIAYELATGIEVHEVGFIKHDSLEWVGCSPDGIVAGLEGVGGLQIKCPFSSAVHVATLMSGEVPPEHMAQIQGEMWVTAAGWWDFVSYDPRMPEHLRTFVKRVKRDDDYIKSMRKEVERFLNEVGEDVTKLLGWKQ